MGMEKSLTKRRRYTFLEHMSDAYIEAYGRDLNEAFDNAARALTDTMVHIHKVRQKIKESFEVKGWDLPNLLYNWLEAVLIKIISEGKVFSSFDVKVERVNQGYRLAAIGRGESLDVKKHQLKVEVKAVTYHLMDIRLKNRRVTIRFLLDL